MEDIVWSPVADTGISLCKYSALQELTSLWNAIFQFPKPLIPFYFRVTKGAVIKAGAAQESDGHAFPFPKSGAARTSRTWEKLPPREALWHLAAAQQCPASGQSSHWISDPLDWTPWLPSSALHLGSCVKFCCSLAYLLPSVYSRAAKQVCIKWHSEVQILLSMTELSAAAICVGALGCMREVSCLSSLPCNPKLKLAEVRGSLSLFSASVDQHHLKPESQYLLNTAFHTWTLCKAEQKEHAI